MQPPTLFSSTHAPLHLLRMLAVRRGLHLALAAASIGLISLTLSHYVNDFEFYRQAAHALIFTGNPYSYDGGYIYPPLLAYLLQPLALLDVSLAQSIWFCINVLICCCMLAIAIRLEYSGVVQRYWSLIALGLAVSPPLRVTLQLGQVSALIATLLLITVWLTKRRPALAGLCLALAAAIKLYPAFLGLYYLRSGPRSVVWWSLLFGAAITGSTIALYGLEPYYTYVTYVLPHNDAPYAAEFNISLVGFWSRLFTDSPFSVPVAHAPLVAWSLIAATSAVVVGICLWTSHRARAGDGQLHASLWLCGMMLLSPMNGYYNLVLLLLPFVTILRRLEQRPDANIARWLTLATALVFIPPTWPNTLPALYSLLHTGWGNLGLAPATYGLGIYLWLLCLLARRDQSS